MKVILAEDSATTRRLLEAVVQACGHEVTAVSDGEAAWEAFERLRPPLVLLDWQMPALDGLEVCRRIRTSARGRDTFVLVITARDGSEDLAGALDAGADDYMVKPVSATHLRARLAIAQRRIEQDAARQRAEAALRHSEQLFRALTEHASDMITILESDGTTRYESPSNERILGYRVDERVGRKAFDQVHPEDHSQVAEAFTKVLENQGVPVSAEFRYQHKDGSWRTIAAVCKNLLDDPAVRGVVVNSRDVTEHRQLEAQLTHQAMHDPLTGLANRALFRDRVARALERAKRRGQPVTALFLDLDNFKAVNDSLGHAAGDQLLVAVAERLLTATRGSDSVARLGGDEFAIVLENARADGDALTVVERVTRALQRKFVLDGTEVFVGASIGVAGAAEGEGPDELLRNADVAMYRAKAQGKGHHVLFEPLMHAAVLERVKLEADLRRAVARGELCLHYQPIVQLAGGEITGVEALVRWDHPERGLIPPAGFIPLAEETGLIVPLGRWVLGEACRQVRRWQDGAASSSVLTLTVNISGRQLNEPGIVEDVRRALHESGLEARSLMLEITESVLMRQTDTTLETLRALKTLGVQLAIDDFGTGYSSLSYLQRFPVDVLKIDKSFIDKIEDGSDRSALARAIISFGEMLSLRTIAEGVKESNQVARLQDLGCELGQGDHFAKPLPAEQLGPLLARQALRAAEADSLAAS